jgi:hypothetical protein
MEDEHDYYKSILDNPNSFIEGMDLGEFEIWIRTDEFGNFNEDTCDMVLLKGLYEIISSYANLGKYEVRLLKRMAECKKRIVGNSEEE